MKPERHAPSKAIDDKEKPKPLVRKKQPEPPSQKQKESDAPKKFINPAALQKQRVEKSILDKRHKKPEDSKATKDEDDDDDDDVQIVGFSREMAPNLGRKSLRKSPLIAKQISPIAKKPAKPVIASKTTPPVATSKATPPVAVSGVKRRTADASADNSGNKAQQSRHSRSPKVSKLSITVDSDDDEMSDEDEPIRRSTRSSLISDKSSAVPSPQNSSVKAKDSSAPTKLAGKDAIPTKPAMSKSVSMPALDKTKMSNRQLVTKPIQTPASKILPKPMAQSTPKPAVASTLGDKKSKSEMNLADPMADKDLKGKDKNKSDQATIRIVNIGDIIKNKAASTPDVRKAAIAGRPSTAPTKDIYASSTESEYSEESDDSEDSYDPKEGKPKTNNQLVATILERKRPINLDHLRLNRSGKRGRASNKQSATDNAAPKGKQANLPQDDGVDFEDMLQTNIVTANKVQKVINPTIARGRGRPPNSTNENSTRPALNKAAPLNKSPATAMPGKTLTSNNNNVYKPNNNGRLGSTTSLNRSGSTSPQKGPPRILNSTMKLGDNRPFAKLIANSDNKHYSIDLTDPDNNVKLIASPGSQTLSPVKRSPVKPVPRPIVASTGLRNTSNAVNKSVGGAVQRSVSAITSTTGSGSKMKKITCYETWYVLFKIPLC